KTPIQKDLYLFLSGFPNPFPFYDKTSFVPESYIEFENIELFSKNLNLSLKSPIITPRTKNCLCEAVSFGDGRDDYGKTDKFPPKQGFLVHIHPLTVSNLPDWLHIKLPLGAQISVDGKKKEVRKNIFDSIQSKTFIAEVTEGSVSYGVHKLDVRDDKVFIYGQPLQINLDGNEIRVSGIADLIVVNDYIVNSSLFGGLSGETKRWLLGGVAIAMLYLIGIAWKNRMTVLTFISKNIFNNGNFPVWL
ncbi:MAG TPA: hypothetical protein PKZ89_05245, partial [Alphaproteobacteria bacterium]|nr:hypothetical protein [Alphaproteobacteria bacterium]